MLIPLFSLIIVVAMGVFYLLTDHGSDVPPDAASPPDSEPPARSAQGDRQMLDFNRIIEQLIEEHEAVVFPSKIVGVSPLNADLRPRQEVIRSLRPYTELGLASEPDNPNDPYTIRVNNRAGEQIGYLPTGTAREVATGRAKGDIWRCWVLDITGENEHTRGVNILMMRYTPPPTRAAPASI